MLRGLKSHFTARSKSAKVDGLSLDSLESAGGLRVLRARKNRFGPAGEVGVDDRLAEGDRRRAQIPLAR